MEETPPPPQPEPARPSEPGPPPPIEVRAEPVPPGERARVVDVPPPAGSGASSSTPPPMPPPPSSAAQPAWRKTGWAVAVHLIGLIDLGLTSIPGVLASLVVWLIKKDEDPEVDFHGKEAINFQITVLIVFGLGVLFSPCLIGIPVVLAAWLAKLVLMIVAAVKAANGERWRYPATLRLLR
jgi:uncharacterized protein